MRKAAKPISRDVPASGQWKRLGALPWLREKSWWVQLDPDVVALLSGRGSPADHLRTFAQKRNLQSERTVMVCAFTDDEIRAIRPILKRLKAKITKINHPLPTSQQHPPGKRKAS